MGRSRKPPWWKQSEEVIALAECTHLHCPSEPLPCLAPTAAPKDILPFSIWVMFFHSELCPNHCFISTYKPQGKLK